MKAKTSVSLIHHALRGKSSNAFLLPQPPFLSALDQPSEGGAP
jgi:hypothetical protein